MGAIYDVAAQLLECARAELENLGPERVPDRICVVPGAELAWDDCECGQLTVHIAQQYASKIFPNPDNTPMSQCGPGMLVVVYVVTILRCIPTGGDDPNPPPCDELAAAALIQSEDAYAIWKGVICCLDDDDHEFTVLTQSYLGPAGVCGGSSLQVAVGFTSI